MDMLLDHLTPSWTDLGQADGLPQIEAKVAHALSQAYSRGAAMDVELAGRGHRFTWEEPSVTMPVCDLFRFTFGDQPGVVALDRVTVAALLGERHTERLPRELRCVLWADALHAVGQALEATTRERLVWAPDTPASFAFDPGRTVSFAITVTGRPEAGRARGQVQFDQPAALGAWLSRWPAGPWAPPRPLDVIRLPVTFVIGRTQVPLSQLRGVRRGDIVGIGDWGSSGSAVRVNARVGGARGLLLTGTVDGARITIQQTRNLAMNREPAAATGLPDDDPRSAAAELPLDHLDAMEVDLRFEVGDVSVSLAELRSIRAGHVFELPQPLSRSAVRIVAHGQVLGKGHLVAVGDQLGVRVSDFAPSEV
jgi:type III secretion protein Q